MSLKAPSSDPQAKSVLKITTWNVASLAARWRDNFEAYVKTAKPDILCIQETKFSEKTSLQNYKIKGYNAYFFNSVDRKGYSGTAIYTRFKPLSVERSFKNTEGRCITMEFNNFYLVNTYCVNAGDELKTLDKKMKWNADIDKCITELEKKKAVIWTGDLNVAHEPIDIWNTTGYDEIAGYTPEERKWFREFLGKGHIDVFRKLYPERQEFTFFNYRGQAKYSNHGWRIDYFVVGEKYYDSLGIIDCAIESSVDGSDHVPVSLFLDKDKALKDEETIEIGMVKLITEKKTKGIDSFFGKK